MFPVSLSFSLLKVQHVQEGSRKIGPKCFICQCLTYANLEYYLQRLLPSKLNAKKQVK